VDKVFHGVMHGKIIELSECPDVADGQEVVVTVQLPTRVRPWGEGILASAGGWADYPEIDGVMEKIQQERKIERRSQG
jgi:hypothetical protein